MIFDKVNNPEVNFWRVSLIKKSYGAGGVFKEETLRKEKLPQGINYVYVPLEFRKMGYPIHYLVNIDGYNASGDVIVSENNIHLNDGNSINDDLIQTNGGIPYAETPCRKTCIGGQYAYSIQQFKRLDVDLSRFRVVPAYKAFDALSQTANPYYWYSTVDQGLSVYNPSYQIQVKSGIDGHVTQVDPGGNPLIGLIWGYQKGLGVWKGQSDIETNGQHTIGLEFCNNTFHTLNTAINLMNASADFSQPAGLPNYPPLECIPANSGTGGGTVPIGNPTPNPKWKGFVTFSFCLGDDGVLHPCRTSPGIDPIAFDPEVVDAIYITDLNNTSKLPIIIDVQELFNTNNGNGGITNGEFKGFNISLTPSLYSFGFMFKEFGYWSKVGEIETNTNFSVTQADMLDATIFPSPITGNKFEIKTLAHASVKFVYELRDFTGELLLSKNFMEHKGHESVRKINAKNIPEGIMLHRFIFEDGSVKTIQTIKN